MLNSSAKVEGNNAFLLGKTRASNPNTQFTLSYLEWLQGWDDAKAKWIKEKRAELLTCKSPVISTPLT